MNDSFSSRIMLEIELFEDLPLHKKAGPLATTLYRHWKDRFLDQSKVSKPVDSKSIDLAAEWFGLRAGPKKTVQTEEPYREPEDLEAFEQIFTVVINIRSTEIPKSRGELFEEAVKRVATLCPDLGYY